MKAKEPKTHMANREHPKSHNGTRIVRFEYINPSARSVYLAGSFNDWHPAVTEMLKIGEDKWAKDLALRPGAYEYRLVVDGQWTTDTACPASTINPYGDRNSVITVAAET
jgi:1,4-alpha-glucan branching enzyme